MDLDGVIELSLETKNSEYLKAADDGELKTLVLLLNAGADIKCMDKDGYSSLRTWLLGKVMMILSRFWWIMAWMLTSREIVTQRH